MIVGDFQHDRTVDTAGISNQDGVHRGKDLAQMVKLLFERKRLHSGTVLGDVLLADLGFGHVAYDDERIVLRIEVLLGHALDIFLCDTLDPFRILAEILKS